MSQPGFPSVKKMWPKMPTNVFWGTLVHHGFCTQVVCCSIANVRPPTVFASGFNFCFPPLLQPWISGLIVRSAAHPDLWVGPRGLEGEGMRPNVPNNLLCKPFLQFSFLKLVTTNMARGHRWFHHQFQMRDDSSSRFVSFIFFF